MCRQLASSETICPSKGSQLIPSDLDTLQRKSIMTATAGATSRTKSDEDDPLVDDVDEEDEFADFITSLRQDGVETGLVVTWPRPHPTHPSSPSPAQHRFHLSTQLQEDAIAPLFDGTQWAGTRVWKAAILGLEYILKEYGSCSNDESNLSQPPKHVLSLLELGCGLGVPGILWYQTQRDAWTVKRQLFQKSEDQGQSAPSPSVPPLPPRVVLTDHPSLLSQLQSNLATNFGDDYLTSMSDNIEAKSLSWSKQGVLDLLLDEQKRSHMSGSSPSSPFSFDICLNCDCIYEPLYGVSSREALCEVLQAVAVHSPQTILVTSVERRRGDGVDVLLSDLANSGVVETDQDRRVPCMHRDDSDPHHIIEIYVTKGIGKVSTDE
jgi:hypothetical protein